MKYLFTLLFAAVFSSAAFSQSEVKIGNQVWMTKNLDVSTFRNGDVIPEVKDSKKWKEYANARKPAWCYYDNESVNGKKYGKLYNWPAIIDPRGLAPEGWHIPYCEEWKDLAEFITYECWGGRDYEYRSNHFRTAEGSYHFDHDCVQFGLKSKNGWRRDSLDLTKIPWRLIPKPQSVNSNWSGFNAQPSGFRNNEGLFIGEYSKYNQSQENGMAVQYVRFDLGRKVKKIKYPRIANSTSFASFWSLFGPDDRRNKMDASFFKFGESCLAKAHNLYGYSVRCIKD